MLSVQIGSFVSGPLLEVLGKFNQEVKDGDILAEIDPRLPKADEKRAIASHATTLGEVKRVEALLQQSRNNEARANALSEENEDFISQTELDQFKFGTMSLEAQLEISKASVEQAQAALDNAQCVVVLWSKRSVESQFVKDEATYALEEGKLLPVRIDERSDVLGPSVTT